MATNIRLGCKCLKVKNTLAYYTAGVYYRGENIYSSGPWGLYHNLITAVIYGFP